MSMYLLSRLSRRLQKNLGRHRLSTAISLTLLAGTGHATGVDLDGSRTLESGTDCQVGAVYRFGTSSTYAGKNLDVLVEIVGEQNDFVSADPVDNSLDQCVGIRGYTTPSFFALSLWGEDSGSDDDDGDGNAAGEPFYMDLRVSIVEQGTSTVEPLDFLTLNLFDLDTASGVATDDVNFAGPLDTFAGAGSQVVVASANLLSDASVLYNRKFRGKASGECPDSTSVDGSCLITHRQANTGTFDVRVGNDSAGAARLIQLSFQEVTTYQTPFANRPVAESKVLNVSPGDTTSVGLATPTDIDGDISGWEITKIPDVGSVTLSGSPLIEGQTGVNPVDISTFVYVAPGTYNGSTPGQLIYKVSDAVGSAYGAVEFNISTDSDGDSIVNSIDIDDDNDGIPDTEEGAGTVDTDGDGLADSLDLDSDNDGIYDLEESGLRETLQDSLDANSDGVIDSNQSFGANGLADSLEPSSESGTTDYNGNGSADTPVDTDGDGLEDYRDLDADNDGLPDVLESDGLDANGDGLLDSGTPTQDPVDTDGDTIADYRDLDADNDGIPDTVEAGGEDADNNGRLDNGTDIDSDGWYDAVNPAAGGTALPNPDTDNDGVHDFRDLDSDGDGIGDFTEAYGLPDTDGDLRPDDLTDADGDGRADAVAALGTQPIDTDGNGIPDYLENTSGPRIETGLDGHGGGALGGAGLMALAMVGAWRRKRLIKPVTVALGTSLLVSGVASADNENFDRRFYGGGSVVASQLEPDTNTTGYGVSNNKSAGYSLNAGYDITPHWTAEVYYTDLGDAEIDRNSDGSVAGNIDYNHAGISAIGYAWNLEDGFGSDNENLSRREGLSAYGRVGVGLMNNTTDLPYERLNDVHLHVGGGLEYGFENGLAARAEVISYDTDALAMQMGVIKRFGDISEPAHLGDSKQLPVVQRVEVQPRTAPLAQSVPPPSRKKVEKVVVQLPYVFFATDKADLTRASVAKLQKLAATMRRYPALQLLVNGHTDSIDSEHYNLNLSLRRAAMVKRYLMTQGIDKQRLQTQAFGETQPVSTNGSPSGRAQNRRVEFKIVQKQRVSSR